MDTRNMGPILSIATGVRTRNVRAFGKLLDSSDCYVRHSRQNADGTTSHHVNIFQIVDTLESDRSPDRHDLIGRSFITKSRPGESSFQNPIAIIDEKSDTHRVKMVKPETGEPR